MRTDTRWRAVWLSLAPFLVAIVALAAFPVTASASPGLHTVRVEGAGALMLTEPQTQQYDFGGGGALGYELRFIPYLGVEARFSAFFFPSTPAQPTVDGYGAAYTPTLGLRLHPLPDLELGDLWIQAGGGASITDGAPLPALEVAVGFELELLWWLRAGPFVRYEHVFELSDLPGAASAGFLQMGVSFAFLGEEPVEEEPVEEEAPPPAPPSDRDGDGLNDDADGCPDEAEDADAFEDDDGCPDPDNDADGVLDESDECPLEAEDRDGFEDDDGCPDPDNDQDSILDGADQCPNEAESPNNYRDEDGCPDEAPESEQELQRLSERILFPNDRVRPTGSSRSVLRRVIALLNAHPEIARIRIEAHASTTGSSEYNLELSRRRGERVRDLLVRGGVTVERLEVQAFGDTNPEFTGGSEDDEAQNRRVIFTVLERAETTE